MTDQTELALEPEGMRDEREAAQAEDSPAPLSSERIPDTYAGIVRLVGRIRADDVRCGTFRIWFGPTECVDLNLTVEQQERIAAVLNDRDTTLVRVQGDGRYRITGELLRAHEVEQVDFLDADLFQFDHDAPTLSEMIERAFADVPDEEWASLPHDLVERHDDYFAEIGDDA